MALRPPALLLALLLAAPPLAAQPAALERALATYERMMAGVENYTLTQEVMGFETTTYFERDGADPLVYRAYVRTPDGWEAVQDDAHDGLAAQAALFRAMRERARNAGTATVNGERAHAVRVEGFDGLERYLPSAPDAEDFTVEAATFYFGADDHLVRRVTMEGTSRHEGRPVPVEVDVTFSDFRAVGGMRHPFRTAIAVKGMEAALSAEERAQARAQLEEARRQMAAMPAAQREMMGRVLGDQLERLEAMLAGDGMAIETVVTALRVNEGRPD